MSPVPDATGPNWSNARLRPPDRPVTAGSLRTAFDGSRGATFQCLHHLARDTFA